MIEYVPPSAFARNFITQPDCESRLEASTNVNAARFDYNEKRKKTLSIR